MFISLTTKGQLLQVVFRIGIESIVIKLLLLMVFA